MAAIGTTKYLITNRFLERVALVALACLLAFATFVSTLSLAELHAHDCAGDDCAVCHVLNMAQALLNTTASSTPGCVFAGMALAFIAVAVLTRRTPRAAETPVSLGIQLLI